MDRRAGSSPAALPRRAGRQTARLPTSRPVAAFVLRRRMAQTSLRDLRVMRAGSSACWAGPRGRLTQRRPRSERRRACTWSTPMGEGSTGRHATRAWACWAAAGLPGRRESGRAASSCCRRADCEAPRCSWAQSLCWALPARFSRRASTIAEGLCDRRCDSASRLGQEGDEFSVRRIACLATHADAPVSVPSVPAAHRL